MTDQIKKAGGSIRYKSPQVKVLGVKMHQVLCQSPVSPWEQGSDTVGGNMDDENGW